MRRTLNVRFLFVLLGCAALLILACRAIHTIQVQRNASALLEQALRAEEQGQLPQAAAYLGNYLAFIPADTEALAHYGLTLEKLPHSTATRERALKVLEQVLRRAADRRDIRQVLVRVALDLGLYADARKHLEYLLEAAPNSAEWERLLALCEEVDGDPERAADWLRKAVAHAPDHIESYLRLAYLLRDRLNDPTSADQVFDALLAANAQSVPALLARARWRREQGQTAEAGDDLSRARELAPRDAEVLLAFADWASATGATTAAETALHEGLEREPRNAALQLALARTEMQQGQPRQALKRLRDALKEVPGQRDLLFLEVQVLGQLGETAAAEQHARRLADADPRDVGSRLLLVDWFFHARNVAGLEQVLAELRRLDQGKEAWSPYVEAAQLLLTASPGDGPSFSQARSLLAEVGRVHPLWSRVPLLEAYADEREGDFARAVESYLRAVELGERRPRILYRLATLLAERRRFAEADQTLRRLEDVGPLEPDVARLATQLALALRDPDRALALARQVVPVAAPDYRDQLWLSQVLHAAGRPEEAEQVLRQQLERTDKIADIWLALVGQLAANQQRGQAAVVLQEAAACVPAPQRALTLARGFELLGQLEQAGVYYQAAVKERAGDFLVLVPAAAFHLRANQFNHAEPHLRKLSHPHLQAPPEQAAWARRQLAVGLATRPGEQSIQEALALLDLNAAAPGLTLDDQRARARVLAARPEQQAEALRLLVTSLPRAPLSPADRLLLARLYEAANDLSRARDEFLTLLAQEPQQPEYLAEYIRALRRWGDEDEARRWTEQLGKRGPEALRLLDREGPESEIRKRTPADMP